MAENIITANSRYARDIGFDYGSASNDVQAELFNGLARGLRTACGGRAAVEHQLYYIVDGLDQSAREMIVEFAEHVSAANS